jgi:ribonuclease BN (tRNA processing enzyme)
VDGHRVLLDLGNGALGALARYADIYSVDAVLLSHLHADHCIDLTSYYVARKYRPDGPLPPLAVYGPSGTADRLSRAYDLPTYPGMRPEFSFHTFAAGASYEVGPFTVTVDRVNHPVEAFGLRVRSGDRVLAYSGDSGPSSQLVRIARDADLFLCEASFHDGRDTTPDLHLNGREAAEHALAASVGRLVLTHLPPWNDPDRTMAEAAPVFERVELAEPGATYDL